MDELLHVYRCLISNTLTGGDLLREVRDAMDIGLNVSPNAASAQWAIISDNQMLQEQREQLQEQQ